MKVGERIWGVAVILAVTLSACDTDRSASDEALTGDTDTGAESAWDSRFDAFADALQDDLDGSRALGISAAVMEGGEVTFRAAFGSKDPDGDEPLTPDTLMQIGSTTKQMTATAVLQKVDAGRFDVQDTLEELLPDLEFGLDPTWDDLITVHHLISHQAGIVDWIPWEGPSDDTELSAYTFGQFDDEFYLMSPPGAFFNYSNPNFILAGVLTEAYDTRFWPDIMAEDVFLPLGMDRTFTRKSEVEADGDYALSYGLGNGDSDPDDAGPVSMDRVADFSWVRPAGLVWTTPTQMMQWARFILEGDEDVLSDGALAEMSARHVNTLPGTDLMHYGYGLFVEPGVGTEDGAWYETPVLEHGGNTLSFTHVFYMLPEHDFAVSICSSALHDDLTHSVLTAIDTLVDLGSPSTPPTYSVEPSTFDRHVGVYNDPWGIGDVIVTQAGDDLRVDIPRLTEAGMTVSEKLEPFTSDIFLMFIDGEPLDVTFIAKTPDGPSRYIRNRAVVATRIDDGTAAAAKRMPRLSDAALRALVKRAAIPKTSVLLRRVML